MSPTTALPPVSSLASSVRDPAALALDVLSDAITRIPQCNTIDTLFQILQQAITFLFPKAGLGVFLRQPDAYFHLACCCPDESRQQMESTADGLIESGRFSRAVRGIEASVGHSASALEHLFPIATPRKIHGMVLLLGEAPTSPANKAMTALLGLVATQLERLEAEVPPTGEADRSSRSSFRDRLTGLADRFELTRFLRDNLSAPQANHSTVVILLGLDRFYRVNRELGLEAGDQLLRDIAARLEHVLTSPFFLETLGLAPWETRVARMSGSEFGVVLTRLRHTDALPRVVTYLHEHLSEGFRQEAATLHLSISVGVALDEGSGAGWQDLLHQADMALKNAAHSGRNQKVFFDGKVMGPSPGDLRIESLLHQALLKDLFEVHFQPQFRLRDGCLSGFEALLRLSPELGSGMSAGRFVPAAEASGQILEIGERVLRLTCRQMRRWESEDQLGVPVGINLSARQLSQADLIPRLLAIIADEGAAASRIAFEVTETAIARDEALAIANVAALRQAGFEVWLDDFGTGYSSLILLRKLPVSGLKLDRTFVRRLLSEKTDRVIVDTILLLARKLGLPLIAEGIETAEQLAYLEDVGCPGGQGFYLGHPLPAQMMPKKWLEREGCWQTPVTRSTG